VRCRIAIPLLAAVAATGCGGEPDDPAQGPRGRPADERGPREDAVLVVSEGPARTARRYADGAVPHVRVVGPDGGVLVNREFRGTPAGGELTTVRLRLGRYTLESYVLPRSAAGRLGDPADHCRAEIVPERLEVLRATIRRAAGRPCEIAVRSESFEVLVGEPVEEASSIARSRGFTLRTVARDGEELVVTQDLRLDRVNVAVEDGAVTAVRGFF
jgi:hypothetical protein